MKSEVEREGASASATQRSHDARDFQTDTPSFLAWFKLMDNGTLPGRSEVVKDFTPSCSELFILIVPGLRVS